MQSTSFEPAILARPITFQATILAEPMESAKKSMLKLIFLFCGSAAILAKSRRPDDQSISCQNKISGDAEAQRYYISRTTILLLL